MCSARQLIAHRGASEPGAAWIGGHVDAFPLSPMMTAALLIVALTLVGVALVMIWVIRGDGGPAASRPAPKPSTDPIEALRQAVEAGEKAAADRLHETPRPGQMLRPAREASSPPTSRLPSPRG
jgi:hypothetical protein